MRILFAIYGSLDQVSGGYGYDRRIIRSLREAGHGVDVIGLRQRPLLSSLAAGWADPPTRRLKALLRSGGYDVFLADELIHPTLAHVPLVLFACVPLLLLVHHLGISESPRPIARIFLRWSERRLLSTAKVVVTTSETTAREVVTLVGRSLRDLRWCRPGFARPARESARKPGGDASPVTLLMTGNLIPRKQQLGLIHALWDMRDSEWNLRLVGSLAANPRYARRVSRAVQRLGLGSRVVFTGTVSDEQLEEEYAQADVFVFPTAYEGYGMALGEAIVRGLPFVAFASGGVAEVTGDRGCLVPSGDWGGLRRALRCLIDDPEGWTAILSDSQSIASGLDTWEDTGRCVCEAVEEAGR